MIAPKITRRHAIQRTQVVGICRYKADIIVENNGMKYEKDATRSMFPFRMEASHRVYPIRVGNIIM